YAPRHYEDNGPTLSRGEMHSRDAGCRRARPGPESLRVTRKRPTKGLATPGPFSFVRKQEHIENRIGMASQRFFLFPIDGEVPAKPAEGHFNKEVETWS